MRENYRPWSPSELDTLRTACHDGKTGTQIHAEYFSYRSLKSVQEKIKHSGWGLLEIARREGLRLPDPTADCSPYRPDVDHDPVPEWLEKLRPVALPAPTPSQTHQEPGDFTLVASDFHFPQHCPKSIAILLETIRQLRPRRLILNGDTVDLLAVSRYPKDQRHVWTLREEVTAFHEFLHEVLQIGNAWGIQVMETEANHSGNGTASRWHRYLSDRVPHLYSHPEAQRLLDYRSWWYPEWCPIELVESVVIADDLLVIHGDLVRKYGGYSSRGHMEKWQSSVMHGHTHRIGQSVRRLPAMGTRPDTLQRSYETGAMCRLDPSYVSAPDWANGFAIIHHDAHALGYGVELVAIQRGEAAIATLGQTVRAA